jgi:hypothetical protein
LLEGLSSSDTQTLHIMLTVHIDIDMANSDLLHIK